MFGYIRPFTPELKVREYEQFRAAYCTLCHTLKSSYGYASRFILNFDFTFLAMLLWPNEAGFACSGKRCPVSPIKKKNVISSPPDSFNACAGYSIILTYWKLKDSIADDAFIKSIKSRAASVCLHRSYKRASKEFPGFTGSVIENLKALSEIENSKQPSIDMAADKFALILAGIADDYDHREKRVVRDLLYHVGRWIYIVDAYNDLDEDITHGNYNPIALKYNLKSSADITDKQKAEVELTLKHSLGRISSAYELLDECPTWSGIIRNIIYLGMPNVFESVKQGKFENKKEKIR